MDQAAAGSRWEKWRAQSGLKVIVFSFLCRYIRQMHHSSASCQVWQHLELRFLSHVHLEWTVVKEQLYQCRVMLWENSLNQEKRKKEKGLWCMNQVFFSSLLWTRGAFAPRRSWIEPPRSADNFRYETESFFLFVCFFKFRVPLM